MARPDPRAPLGEGGRFAALKASIERRARKGPKRPDIARQRQGGERVDDPGALAAFLGRKAHGAKKMAQYERSTPRT